MRTRDILAIVLVALLTFPILYVIMMFSSGAMRIEYGFKEPDHEEEVRVEEVKHTARRDSLAAENTKIFEAAQKERADLAREQERLAEQYTRLEMLQADIEQKRQELVNERTLLENKMAVVPDAEDARYKRLARIYESMKPGEAAGILETLPDAQTAAIIGRMGDNRQKARIMALLTKEKAARLNRLLK